MKRVIIPITALACLAIAAGCNPSGKQNPSTGGGGSVKSDGKKIKVAFVTNNTSDYWADARKGTDQAAKELPDVDVRFIMPDDGSAATQKARVDELVANGVQGIAISPVDPDNQTEMLNEVAKKTVLMTQDSDAPKSNRLCYIGTNNHDAGVMAADLIKKALPNGGKIMLFVGKRDAQNAKEREAGIREGLNGSKVTIVDVRTDDTDRARAKANVSDTIVKYPDIAGLVGLWSYNGPQIMNAVQEAHKDGKIKIICFDTDPGTLPGVKSGVIFGTVIQKPYQFGYQAVKDLVNAVKGDKSWVPASKVIFIPTIAVTKDNVDKVQELTSK